MIAEFRTRHKSITGFESVDFPDFTILTGRNGSGKTHLLQAIDQGYVVIQGIPSDDIRYFNYHSFVVSTADENEKYRPWNQEGWLLLQEARANIRRM